MKLKELAEIRLGLEIPHGMLVTTRRAGSTYHSVVTPSSFSDGIGYFVSQKDLKKLGLIHQKLFLFYGDYLLFTRGGGELALMRYEDLSGQTIPSSEIFIISTDINILTDFFSIAKNKKYFLVELKRKIDTEGKLTISAIQDIDIMTDNVMELEQSNKAEQLGIRQPIDKKDLPFRITQKPLPIDKLIKRIQYNELLLDAEFQRRPGLWDITTKSRLVESMIIRIPIPAFYFDGTDDNCWLVIDGLQRLSAVNDFVQGRFALTNLDYLPELEDKQFSDLDRTHQRNIEEYEIFAYILEKGTPKSVVYKIFKNINTSALKLELQEIRHAINPGAPASLLKEIAEKEWFKSALLLSDRQRDRMEDREIALRFIAFQRTNYTEYKPTMGNFLDTAITDIYEIPRVRQEAMISDLQNIFEIIENIFDGRAFSRSLFDDGRTYGHNNIIFELLTYAVGILSTEKRKILLSRKVKYAAMIRVFFSNKKDRFWETESAYSQDGLRKRFEEIELLTKDAVK